MSHVACCRVLAVIAWAVTGATLLHGSQPLAPVLPPAGEFRVTLAEDAGSDVSPGPACVGETAATLTCRAFALTLENIGTHTVRLNGVTCAEPEVRMEERYPPPHGGWGPAGSSRDDCGTTLYGPDAAGQWKNIRLKPGDRQSFTARLLVPKKGSYGGVDGFDPGPIMLRAQWTLRGCTEPADGVDCLTPLQGTHLPGITCSNPCIFFQPVVTVASNEITVSAPERPKLPPVEFRLSLTARTARPADVPAGAGSRLNVCTAGREGTVDCVLLHLTVRNAGAHAVRLGRMSCSDFAETPELRHADGTWTPLRPTPLDCAGNAMWWAVLLPGQTIEEDMTAGTVAAGFDLSPIREAGDYTVRITYAPMVCIAAPDGSFCLTTVEQAAKVVSPPASFHTASLPRELTNAGEVR